MLILVTFIQSARAQTAQDQAAATEKMSILDVQRVKDKIALFSSLGSRFTGYPGFYNASQIISEEFKNLGLNTRLFNYTTLVPYDEGSWLKIGNRTFRVYPLYPNLIATGKKCVSGKLVYAGHGSLKELSGLDIKGNIVLLEFNSQDSWITVVKLGASAIVFLEDGPTTRFEAMSKITSVPLSTPRVYATKEVAEELRKLASKKPKAELFNGMRWKDVEGVNVVGEIRGSEDPSKVIIITAHYDSVSVIPAISPGADDAVSISLLLEFIRILKLQNFTPKYTIWFIATSGHWQALSGAREFVEKIYFNNSEIGKKIFPYLVIDLEITSGSPHVNIVSAGSTYKIMTAYSTKKLNDLINLLYSSLLSFQKDYPQCWNIVSTDLLAGLTGLSYNPSLPTYKMMTFNHMFDMEPFQLANSIGLGFVTFDDLRLRFFSPSDTVDFVDLKNVVLQAQFIFHTLFDILKSPISSIYSGSWEDLKPLRVGEAFSGIGFATLEVESVKYDLASPNLYTPVSNALIIVGNPANPFSLMIAKSNASGFAEFHGLKTSPEAGGEKLLIQSYKLDENGSITYAPDSGPKGAGTYPASITMASHPQIARTVLFACGSALIFDLTDPSTLQASSSPSSLYEDTNVYSSVLNAYAGYESPLSIRISIIQIPSYTALDSWGFSYDPLHSIAQIYAPPKDKFAFIVRSTSLDKIVAIYANTTINNQDGSGYLINNQGDELRIDGTIVGMLHDFLTLSYGRYLTQVDAQVVDPNLAEVIHEVIKLNRTVLKESSRKNYGCELSYALLAWGLSIKSYEYSFNVLKDSATSALMTFILTFPFILLSTSLIYGLTRGWKSIAVMSSIILMVTLDLVLFHPAFKLATNIPAIFVGTLIMGLVVPVLFFLLVNFSSSLGKLRKSIFGAHFLERSSFEVSLSAVSIGIGNLRKRKLRTFLTLTTVLLVSFALTSLTSITEMKALQVSPTRTFAKYNGILLRTANFFPLNKDLMRLISMYFSNTTEFAGRYWIYLPSIPQEGGMGKIIVTSKSNSRRAVISALVGISPLELNASFMDFNKFKVEGSMFSSNDLLSAIIPYSLAQYLNVSIGEDILICGLQLKVIGILNTTAMLEYVKDSDGYVDVLPMNTYILDNDKSPPKLEAMLDYNSVIYIPEKLAELIPGASLTSIFIPMNELKFEDLYNKASRVFSAFDELNVYLTYNGSVYLFTKKNIVSIFGFQFVIFPIIIAGLILMSTVLGGTVERLKECSIYSSLGLAPLQVGLIFLGESVIYAIVGSMIGYLTGILASHLLVAMKVTELGTNYTSLSVSVTIGSMLAMVLLASLYPLYKVSSLVTPSLERKWKLSTKPKDDQWEIPFPFRIRDKEKVAGFMIFMYEYLYNKRIERAEVFTVKDLSIYKTETSIGINSLIWLAPYEQNIEQNISLIALESKTEQRFLLFLTLRRISGTYESWIKSNYFFIDDIRKQMLVWNLLSPEEEKRYIQMAKDRNLIG
ncbi:MAG: M28 family peptidase [Thermoproteota archaeon]